MRSLLILVLAVVHLSGGVQAAITGSQFCNKYMCVTGKHDDSKKIDTWTLDPPKGSKIRRDSFGWIAIGFGATMANTPMIIAWPNSDGSITLSQRSSKSNVMPTVVSNPPRKASLLTSSSFSDSTSTSITFTVPSSSNTTDSTNIIWAYSTTNPKSSAVNANIVQHLASGNTKLNLLSTQPINSTTSSTSGSSSSSSTSGNRKALIAHVAVGAVATMAVLPIGIIIPRIARGLSTKRWWFPAHAAVNGLIGMGLVIAAFGIAVASFEGGINSGHRKLGLTLFILTLLQTALGLFVHFYQRSHRLQTASGRGPTNFLHVALGVVIVGIGFGTAWKGIDEEWGLYSGTGKPSVGWKVGWGLIVAIVVILYLGGYYLLPRQRRNEHSAQQWASSIGRGHDEGKTVVSSNSSYVPPPPPPPPPQGTFTSQPSRQSQSAYYAPPPLPPPAHPARRLPPPLPSNRPGEYEMSTR
ncbi:hypothetical protein CI109_102842 [Kwoniella shandongensis]|uniref:Uncharacterized protein n=1 Tax=Kwoniella shandongensis TaxID=1734106 RepID=A0A5M6C800_9TREE|nr:uncharacterized protein CI109_000032 [Kwoniella shandongensis]KAA5531194.1 hypothetical protein CI109_000032 [Kwoniella shandongensis]